MAALVLVAGTAQGCGKRSGPHRQTIEVGFFAPAEHASLLRLSDSGGFAAAELLPDTPPPVADPPAAIRLWDTASSGERASGEGWLAGAPTDAGDQLIMEADGRTLRWLVGGGRLALEPGPGDWRRAATAAAEKRIFAVIPGGGRGSGYWVAAIDPARLQPIASRTLSADEVGDTAHAERCQLAGGGAPARMFLVCAEAREAAAGAGPARVDRWRVTALGRTLATVWKQTVEIPAAAGPGVVRAEVTGDGNHLVLAHGRRASGLLRVDALVSMRAGDGTAEVVTDVAALPGPVRALAPVPGSAEVALLHVYEPPAHPTVAGDSAFEGVSTFDAATGTIARTYRTGREQLGDRSRAVRALSPASFAVGPDGVVLLGAAPP